MPEQSPLFVARKVFTLAPAALAHVATLPVVADQYPIIATSTNETADCLHIYWDTADYRLLRTGFAVRLEQSGDQLQLSVENLAATLEGKLNKQLSRRVCVTAPIAAGKVAASLKAWPKPLRKAVSTVLSGHAKLQPILRLQHRCESYAITLPTTADPTLLAQVNVELATVWAPTDLATADLNHLSAPDPASAITTIGQLSLAFSLDTDPVQAAITASLASHLELQSTRQSLFERALLVAGLHVPGADTTSHPQMPIAEACRLIWREQLLQLLLMEAGVRYSQDREYVHEMRVAIRRARAAAELYGDFLPRKTIRPYLAALRKMGRLLGHMRNLDVAISKGRRLRTADGENVRAPKKLVKEWQKRRQLAQQAVVKWLDSTEYSEFLSDFQQFCTTEKFVEKFGEKFADKLTKKRHARATAATPHQVRHVIPASIMAGYAAVRCYEDSFTTALTPGLATNLATTLTTELSPDVPTNSPDSTAVDYIILHDLRIACKSLRYNLEFTHHLLGAESAILIKQVKAVQDLLGDLNDAVTALALLEESAHVEAASAYQHTQTQLMVDLRARVPATLATLVAQESRQLLGRALAAL